MSERIELGKAGEEIAAEFLEKKGYHILERNWKFGKNEIDIIARDGNSIVIAEVKTRSSNFFTEPETAVTRDKQRILVRAANAYMNYRKQFGEVRFDVIAILIHPESQQVNHIVDAFYATLR
jgi:putative endonuclease